MKEPIKFVYLWSNGMVMVFDDEGEQVTELQGPKHVATAKLLDVNLEKARFYMGNWETRELIEIPRDSFFCEAWEVTSEYHEWKGRIVAYDPS